MGFVQTAEWNAYVGHSVSVQVDKTILLRAFVLVSEPVCVLLSLTICIKTTWGRP